MRDSISFLGVHFSFPFRKWTLSMHDIVQQMRNFISVINNIMPTYMHDANIGKVY